MVNKKIISSKKTNSITTKDLLPILMKASALRLHDGHRSLSVIGLTILVCLKDFTDTKAIELNLSSFSSYLDVPRSTFNATIRALENEGLVTIVSITSTYTRPQHVPRLTKDGLRYINSLLK